MAQIMVRDFLPILLLVLVGGVGATPSSLITSATQNYPPSGILPPRLTPSPTLTPPTTNTLSPSTPSSSTPSPTPHAGNGQSSSPKTARCGNKNFPKCYNTDHVCPNTCPGSCDFDCYTCKPVCSKPFMLITMMFFLIKIFSKLICTLGLSCNNFILQ